MKAAKIYLSLLPLLVAGCATVYKPNGLGGGYTDYQYAEDIFEVGVRGNGSFENRVGQVAC
jgi:hypothetical protein